jgi:hypothetical protein
MKRLTLIIIVGLLFIASAIATDFGLNRESELDKIYKDKIDGMGVESIMRGDIFCDRANTSGKTCHQIITKGNHTFPMVHIRARKCEGYRKINNKSNATKCIGWIFLTEAERKTEIAKAGNKMLEDYAKSLIIKEEGKEIIEDKGEIILKER